jgi:hypothetical protein
MRGVRVKFAGWRALGGAAALALLAQIVLAGPARGQTEPSWPQRFQVLSGEAAAFGFAVGQAGAISVEVTTQGSAARVTLSGPIAQPIQQTGSGTVRLSYNVTAADIQKSSIWVVRVAEANPGPVAPIAAPRAVILGTVTVQHPAANMQLATAELQRMKAAVVQRVQSRPPARLPDVSAAMKAAYARQIASQQATQKQQLLAAINRKPVALAGTPNRPTIAPKIAPNAPSVRTSGSGDPPGGAPSGAASSSGSAPPAPQITSLSIKQGQPRDAVLITGSGFGANQGQVHFIINPQMDKTAPVDYWSDTQILTYVPDTSGVRAFPAGQVYLQTTGGQKSALNPFQFNPTLDFAQIQPVWNEPDVRLDQTDLMNSQSFAFTHSGGGDPWWHSSDDVFYPTTVLKNGWVVDSALVTIVDQSTGLWIGSGRDHSNAYAAEYRAGTPALYLKVHWWTDPWSTLQYTPILRIKGPLGVPYR